MKKILSPGANDDSNQVLHWCNETGKDCEQGRMRERDYPLVDRAPRLGSQDPKIFLVFRTNAMDLQPRRSGNAAEESILDPMDPGLR